MWSFLFGGYKYSPFRIKKMKKKHSNDIRKLEEDSPDDLSPFVSIDRSHMSDINKHIVFGKHCLRFNNSLAYLLACCYQIHLNQCDSK